jgi:hypothetical protein
MNMAKMKRKKGRQSPVVVIPSEVEGSAVANAGLKADPSTSLGMTRDVFDFTFRPGSGQGCLSPFFSERE